MKLSEVADVEQPTQGGALKLSQVQADKQPVLDRAANWLMEAPGRAWDAMRGTNAAGEPQYENHPELPYSAQMKLSDANINPARARTLEGQVNMLRQVFPKATVAGNDKFGNPLIVLGEPTEKTRMSFGTGESYEPGQMFYLNKPGASVMDFTAGGGATVERVAPVVAASAAMGPAAWYMATPAVGATGAASELAAQAGANAQGAAEGIDAKQVALAGIFSSAGEGTGRFLSATFGLLSKRMGPKFAEQVLNEAGQLTDDAVTALRNSGIDPAMFSRALAKAADKTGLSPQQALSTAAAEQTGVKLTTGQRTSDVPQLRAEEIARQSGNPNIRQPLVDRDIANNRAIRAYADDTVSRLGGTADDTAAGGATRTALRAKEAAAKQQANRFYTDAKEAAGVNTPFPKEVRDSFFQKAVPVLDDFADDVPLAIRNRLEAFGLFGKQTRDFNFAEGEKFRELLNTYAQQQGPKQAAVLRLKAAYDEATRAIEQQPGQVGELFKQGRAAVSSRKAEFNQKDLIEKIIARKTPITDVIADEQVVPTLLSKATPARDVDRLLKSLRGADNGNEAIKSMQSTIFRRVVDKSLIGKNEAGEQILSGAAFKRELDKIGADKLKLLYGPDIMERIHAIRLASDALTNMPRGAVNTSYTATFVNEMQRASKGVPFLNYLVGKLDLANRAAVKRALSERALTESQRRFVMGSRVLPKAGAAVGMEEAAE